MLTFAIMSPAWGWRGHAVPQAFVHALLLERAAEQYAQEHFQAA